jgi:hypothetical protein
MPFLAGRAKLVFDLSVGRALLRCSPEVYLLARCSLEVSPVEARIEDMLSSFFAPLFIRESRDTNLKAVAR